MKITAALFLALAMTVQGRRSPVPSTPTKKSGDYPYGWGLDRHEKADEVKEVKTTKPKKTTQDHEHKPGLFGVCSLDELDEVMSGME